MLLYTHFTQSVQFWRKRNINKNCLCYSIVYHYNGAQRYEQFLQVGWLYWALILLGLALYLPSASVSLVLMVPYRYRTNFFCLHPSLYLLVSWAWWDWPLTWLTNHRPPVLWHCWLGHVTRKTVSQMTYNVSSGTLNSTIPYQFSFLVYSLSVEIYVILAWFRQHASCARPGSKCWWRHCTSIYISIIHRFYVDIPWIYLYQ